jgi:hypothetical protein
MKPHPRIRKTIKWGGLALGLLLAGVWVRSEVACEMYCAGASHVYYVNGTLAIGRGFIGIPESWYVRRDAFPGEGGDWWCHGLSSGRSFFIVIPLWIPLAPTFLATAAAWRLDALARRLARTGLCPKCGYDRAGLASSAVCPECGKHPASA